MHEMLKQNLLVKQSQALQLVNRIFQNQQHIYNKFNISQIEVHKAQVQDTYQFPHFQQKNTIEYVAFLPNLKSTEKPIGIVAFFHGTLLGKQQIPTKLGPEIKSLAALYCSQNFIFIVPNLIGYQNYQTQPHPYITLPAINVQSMVNVLNHVRWVIITKYEYRWNLTSERIKVFVNGYSEGALYSIMFPQYQQKLSEFYLLISSSSLSGPVDLMGVMLKFLKEQAGKKLNNNQFNIENQVITNFAKPSLSAMLLNSFVFYYFGESSFQKYVVKNFYNMKCGIFLLDSLCLINKNQYNLQSALLSNNNTSQKIAKSIGWASFGKKLNEIQYLSEIPINKLQPIGYEDGYRNSIKSLISSQILDNSTFQKSLIDSNPIQFKPKIQTFLFYLKWDSVVPPLNSKNYWYKYNQSKIIQNVQYNNENYQVCQVQSEKKNVDHLEAEIIANIYNLNYINVLNSRVTIKC